MAITLTRREGRELAELRDRLATFDPRSQPELFIIEAQVLSAQLSERLRRKLQIFKRFSSPSAALLIRGLPIGEVPATPAHADAGVGAHLRAACAVAIVVAVIGDQFGFRPELGGNIFQDILPVAGFEDTQQSISSRTGLKLHVETAFSDERADFVALLCLRSDRDGHAGTLLAPVRSALELLDAGTIAVLRGRRFATTVDASFLRGTKSKEPVLIGPIAAIEGSDLRPRCRVDFEEARGLDVDAQTALESLRRAAEEVQEAVNLEESDLLIVDNHASFHGRAAFKPYYDGLDRWLLRTFLTLDLGRSVAVRAEDGRVIDADFRHDPKIMQLGAGDAPAKSDDVPPVEEVGDLPEAG